MSLRSAETFNGTPGALPGAASNLTVRRLSGVFTSMMLASMLAGELPSDVQAQEKKEPETRESSKGVSEDDALRNFRAARNGDGNLLAALHQLEPHGGKAIIRAFYAVYNSTRKEDEVVHQWLVEQIVFSADVRNTFLSEPGPEARTYLRKACPKIIPDLFTALKALPARLPEGKEPSPDAMTMLRAENATVLLGTLVACDPKQIDLPKLGEVTGPGSSERQRRSAAYVLVHAHRWDTLLELIKNDPAFAMPVADALADVFQANGDFIPRDPKQGSEVFRGVCTVYQAAIGKVRDRYEGKNRQDRITDVMGPVFSAYYARERPKKKAP